MPLDPSLLRSAFARTARPVTADEAISEFGGGARGRSALAQAIAGTSDKKSRAYKAAMRNLQRYSAAEGKQRRTPKKLTPQITKAVQMKRTAARLKGPITIRWTGPVIKVSDDERQRLDFDAELSDEDLAEVREHLEAGDDQAAIDALAAASLADYLGDVSADASMSSAVSLRISRG
jgi:hypothetical protein